MAAATMLSILKQELADPRSRPRFLYLAWLGLAAYLAAFYAAKAGLMSPEPTTHVVLARGGSEVIGGGWATIFAAAPVAFSLLVAVLCIIRQFDPIRRKTWLTFLWTAPALCFAAYPHVYTLALMAWFNVVGINYLFYKAGTADDWIEDAGGSYDRVAKRMSGEIRKLRAECLSQAVKPKASFKMRQD